ncbi:T9SS type B sorting domain-containing protein [Lacinutrix undariae]
MKKITLLIFAFLSVLCQVNAQVAVGSGNLESENAPFDPYFGYSYTQSVYLASEINASGTITAIQWYYSGASDLDNCQELVIYMAESTRADYADTSDWEPIASFTQVYAGGIDVSAGAGWVQLTLDTPFVYTGVDNLIVAAEDNMVDYDTSADDFYNSDVATMRTISYYSDGTNPDPAAPVTASNIDDTIPNIILDGIQQSCPTPSTLVAGLVTFEGAELSWEQVGTATSWNIEVVPAGDAPTGVATATGVSSPYTLSGLEAVTAYDFYVQADCSTEVSAWAGPVSFTTTCGIFTPDYLATFDSFLQECWEEAGDGDPTTGPTGIGAGGWSSDGFANVGFNGANKINLYNTGDNEWLLSPQFDLTGGPFQVELDLAIMDYSSSTTASLLGSDDQVQVLISTDNGVTWTPIMLWDNTSVVPAGGSHYVFNLDAYLGMTAQFAIWATEGTVDDPEDVDVSVDNFEVRAVPTCAEPSELAVSGVTSDGATFGWLENGTATSWNIEVVASGETPTGTPTVTVSTNPYTVTGLNATTDYDFYVQTDCGASGTSSWEGPVTFTTLCDVYVPDYLATFDSFLEVCWDEADSGDPTTGPGDLGAGSWTGDGYANDGFNGANKINLYTTGKSDWLLSPLFDLTGGPFQVELDLAIMAYASSTNERSLGSDDQVQLLITTDNGATWTPIILWDNTSVVPAGGSHYVFNLAAYAGMTVQFGIWATEGTVDDPEDVDVSFDNFQVRAVPTCPEPTELTSTNLSLTSTEVAWVENGTSTTWNIELVAAGDAPTGVPTVTGVTTNPYILTDLTSDTAYEFYVQADCGGAEGTSSWTGPSGFFTGYCESIPTSNDGNGVGNVFFGITNFPSFGDETYENHTATVVNAFQGFNTNLQVTFVTGTTYGTNVWIDFNDNLVFDADELVYQGTSLGDNPSTLDASFMMPADAAIGEHRMRIGTADFGQSTPNPCYSGSWGVTLDFTVNILEPTCVNPEATYTVVNDCENGDQFLVDVVITTIGDADSLTISNTIDSVASTENVIEPGTYQVGPFPFLEDVIITISNDQDENCVIVSPVFNLLACPPDNDNPCNATIAVVNDNDTCDVLTSGTLVASTDSGVPTPECSGNPDDDVWFEFVALNEVQLISITNIIGGTTNIDHAVYEGTCDTLVELYCSTDTSSITTELTVGNTYFIRVYSSGTGDETSTFDLCIKEAPANTICEDASPFCGSGGALYGSNVIGIPSSGSVACLGSIPNPSWNILQIGETGPINIQIEQNTEFDDEGNGIGQGLDVDFVLWGPFDSTMDYCELDLLVDCPTCPNNTSNQAFYPFENIVDCSYSGADTETVTIENAVEGEIYVLLVTNFSNDPGTIQIEQTNATTDGSGSVTAEIEVDLGEDQNLCGYDSYDLIAESPFADRYEWYKNGIVIEGASTGILTVTETDTYTVIAYDDSCETQAQDSVTIIFGIEPTVNVVDFLETCDDTSADGIAEFNLALQTSAILGTQDPALFNVTYHESLSNAQTGTDPIDLSLPYTSISNPQTIYVRIQDANATFCSVTNSFELQVNGTCIFPEGISPNGDGVNDNFDLRVHNVDKIEIFNRNGTLVYSKKNYIDEWHGQSDKGDILPVGTYFYTMTYNNGTESRSAWVYINK